MTQPRRKSAIPKKGTPEEAKLNAEHAKARIVKSHRDERYTLLPAALQGRGATRPLFATHTLALAGKQWSVPFLRRALLNAAR